MADVLTKVEILNLSLTKVAEIKNLYPINRNGDILRYSKELSDYGKCTFRVSTKDPLFTQFGDILAPHANHVRINRGGTVVWSGVIVDNPERNRNYVEVRAVEYEYYLDKILIRRDSETVTGDGKNNYRTFSSGTMASAVTTLINNAITDFGAAHPMSDVTIGTVDNPNYPNGFVGQNNVPMTGPWSFNTYATLQFDYHTVAYVLKAFGLYTNCDYEITEDLVFNYKEFIGNKQTNVVFEYGTFGNVVDYNLPRLGQRVVNDMWGIAADSDGKILHANQRDEASVQAYGKLQDARAFADVKDLNFLKTRLSEELQFVKTADDAPVTVLLNEKSYPLGQYGLGDIVTVKINDHVIDYNKPRRIVGITVTVHNTGREMIACQTNRPLERDMGS